MPKNETDIISCIVIHETDAAILINAGTDEQIWMPKSQLADDTDLYNRGAGECLELEFPVWLLMDKGLL